MRLRATTTTPTSKATQATATTIAIAIVPAEVPLDAVAAAGPAAMILPSASYS